MKFWDASAVVPLVLAESSSLRLRRLARTDPEVVVWWGTEIECASALARRQRDGSVGEAGVRAAFDRLARLARMWQETEPGAAVREIARRLLRVHPLRAADALQLAAAVLASGSRPPTLEFVTLDERLATAARVEGFPVID